MTRRKIFPSIRKLILPPSSKSFTSWMASEGWSDFVACLGASQAAE